MRHHKVVGEAGRQISTVQIHNALIAFASSRINGQRQYAIGHQVGQSGIRLDLIGVKAGQPANFALAGAFDHQQRHRAFGARLQAHQTIKFQAAHQQRRSSHQLTQQLLNRLGVSVFGQHFGVTVIQRGQLATRVTVVENKALGEVGFR